MISDSTETLSVIDLLRRALTSVVFGNGWLVVTIAFALVATTVLSRVFKGGSL